VELARGKIIIGNFKLSEVQVISNIHVSVAITTVYGTKVMRKQLLSEVNTSTLVGVTFYQ